MARYTVTLRDWLISKMKNDSGVKNGLGLKATNIEGEFFHYNEIIDKTYHYLFEDMQLYCNISTQFKKDFCKEFYNREICCEVFAQFQILLENTLNVDCFMLLKYLDKVRTLTDDDLIKNIDVKNDSKSSSDSDSEAQSNNGSLHLGNTTPNTKKDIIFSQNDLTDNEKSLIDYANSLEESYNKGLSSNKNKMNGDSNSRTYGYQGRTLLDVYMQLLSMGTDIERQIFNICDKNFI